MARLVAHYKEVIAPAMQEKFAYKNPMEIPKLVSVVVNMGVGEGARDKKQIEYAVRDLTAITGQKPVICLARKSVAGFKIRAGMPIGVKVTLRSKMMFEFVDRLVNMSLPRVRDFRGLSNKGFDGRGNYSMGIKEQTVFYEINYDTVDRMRGMQLTFVTTAKTNEEGEALLYEFGLPFKKKRASNG
ncbi:MAG: 50S ribosomal protein L5 [Alphaproteobacteria bacterium]|nr:50S ribosomal protein L5 [Alphaproteobacteria bacterium]